ncbi:MAG: DNA polymerase III subunit beta [Desulfomonilia bacterium]|nr:DNA polymerase III subunit beta [Desulfomonilia bacterium]
MKYTIPKDTLQGMLAKVQGFTERKSTLPILSHVLMETGDDKLRLKATDLHTSIQVISSCEIKEQGACAISAKSLYDVVRELPDGKIDIWVEDHTRAHIHAENNYIKMNVMDPEEYPVIDFSLAQEGFHVPVHIMKPMIERTMFSVPSQAEGETKYTLNGALLTATQEKKGSYLEMVTTDSRRLSVARYEIDQPVEMGEGIIIPRKGLQEIRRLMDNREENASILLTRESIFFVSEDTRATVRLIEGKFPDYRSVVTLETYPTCTRVNAQELLSVLKVCVAMVSDISNCVRFSFKKDRTLIFANNPDQGEVDTEIAADHNGEDIDINFNPRYVMECLVYIDGEAHIHLKGPQGPCMITDGEKTDCKWVIMPMRF